MGAGGSLNQLILFGSVAGVFALVAGYLFKKKSAQQKKANASEKNHESEIWHALASSLFEANDNEVDLEQRIEIGLRMGMKRMQLRFGALFLHSEGKCRVLALTSESGHMPRGVEVGSEFDSAKIFTGFLDDHRPSLSVNAASVSEWRNHPAYLNFCWESFIGAKGSIHENGEEEISVAFFDYSPREQLFTKAERDFVQQVALWIALTRDRMTEVASSPSRVEEIQGDYASKA